MHIMKGESAMGIYIAMAPEAPTCSDGSGTEESS